MLRLPKFFKGIRSFKNFAIRGTGLLSTYNLQLEGSLQISSKDTIIVLTV